MRMIIIAVIINTTDMPPSQQEQNLEKIAWRTVDEWCKTHPKPRLSPRQKHRAKIWARGRIGSARGMNPEVDYLHLDEYQGQDMVSSAMRDID